MAGSPSRLSAHMRSAVNWRELAGDGILRRRGDRTRSATSHEPGALHRDSRMLNARMRGCGHSADSQIVEASFSRSSRRGGPSLERPACENPAHESDTREPQRYNEFGQPIGADLPGWKAPPFPPHVDTHRALLPAGAAERRAPRARVFEAQREDRDGERWTYLFHGPYTEFAPYEQWCIEAQASRDPQFYAIVDAASGRAVGTAAYMRIEPRHGVIEVGNIYFAPRLAEVARRHRGDLSVHGERLRARLSALRMEMRQLQSAVARRGDAFRFHLRRIVPPGHRQQGPQPRHHLVRHHRRDWKRGLQDAYLRWLDPANFDAAGRQKLRLSELTAPFVACDSAQAWPPLALRA